MKKVFFILFLGLLIPLTALADLTLNYVGKGKSDIVSSVIYLKGDKLRVDLVQKSGEKYSLIFKYNPHKEFIVINHGQQEYTIIDEQALVSMKEMMKQMKARLAQMPPQMREMAKQMMRMQSPPEVSVKPVVIKKEKLNGIPTVVVGGYKILKNGKEEEITLWLADGTKLGITKQDYKLFENFLKFEDELASVSPHASAWKQRSYNFTQKDYPPNLNLKIPLPVKQAVMVDHKEVEAIELKSISKQKLDDTLFTLPEGYTKRKIQPPARRMPPPTGGMMFE